MTKYIALDFETSGLDPAQNQILEGYFIALDSKLSKISDLHVFIKSDPTKYQIDSKALAVNKIDLNVHDNSPNALTVEEAKNKIIEFFVKNGSNQKYKPKLIGHNVDFDRQFLINCIGADVITKYTHYSYVCTKIIADFLKEAGVLPPEVGTLESLSKFYNLKTDNFHNAKDDVLTMIRVYDNMIAGLKNNRSNNFLNIDILSLIEK